MAQINDRHDFALPKRESSWQRKGDTALITDARGSWIRNYGHRHHVYAALQWLRAPLLLLSGAFYLWWDMPRIATILVVIPVPMPWIMVVITNDVGELADKRKPRVYKPGVVRKRSRKWEEQQRQRALKEMEIRTFGSAASTGDTDVPPQPGNETISISFNGADVVGMPEEGGPPPSSPG